MKDDEVVMSEGRTYVSVDEFAKRMGCARNTVKARLYSGKLEAVHFDKRKKNYIDWENGKKMWRLSPPDSTKAKAGNVSANQRYNKPLKGVSGPKVKPAEVDDLTADMPDPIGLEDLSAINFDKERYGDCYDDGVINYDRLKMRLTAETYKLKYDKDRGLLVPKSEVLILLKELAAVIQNATSSIPQRYTSMFTATAEGIVKRRIGQGDFEFFEAEKKELRTALEGVGGDVMNNIRLKIKEFGND